MSQIHVQSVQMGKWLQADKSVLSLQLIITAP